MGYFENGQVAIVTGGGSGIGRDCSLLFAREGANVVVSDINAEHGEEVVNVIQKQGGNAAFKAANVAKPAEVEALVKFSVDHFGGLHGIVNNAGIGGDQAAAADYGLEAWDKMIAINQNGVFYGMK